MNWNTLQILFKGEVEAQNGEVLKHLRSVRHPGARIYHEAYYLRLQEFLRDYYPACFACWSRAEGVAIARAYAQKYPPSSFNAAEFGGEFSEFLCGLTDGAEFLPDLARLEWQLVQTRYALELGRVGFERIARASEEEWLRVRFQFDSAVSFLESEWPLLEIYANGADEYSRGALSPFLIYRDEGVSTFRKLDAEEYSALSVLSRGEPVANILALRAEWVEDWTRSGLLREICWEI